MKIHDHITTFSFPGHAKVMQEKQMVRDVRHEPAEQSIKVTISAEGYENYRKCVSDKQDDSTLTYDEMLSQREKLLNVRLSPDMQYGFRLSEEANRLNEKDQETLNGSRLSWQDKAENIVEAYTNLYDEIVQGYESGTRKINVADPDSEQGYRTLTMEEELNALDEAYERAVTNFEEIERQNEKAQKIISEYITQIARITEGRMTALTAAYMREKKEEPEKVPDDLAEKMLSIKDNWKNSYMVSTKGAAWQIHLFS